MKLTLNDAAAVTIAIVAFGCEGRPLRGEGSVEDAESSTSSDGAASTTTSGEGGTTTGEPASEASTHTDEPNASAGVLDEPENPGAPCDPWTQNCPAGEKCAPWDSTGQGAWNATKCVPVDPNPAQPGEPCHVVESAASGIDDCDLGSVCWAVDPETLEGTCVAQCHGTESDPTCSTPGTVCSISNSGSLTLCLQECSPALGDCPPGQTCYGVGNTFICAPESAPGGGGYGDPCDQIGVCDPGLFCANARAVPECKGGSATGCCSSYCDLSDADPDASCAAYSPTLVCVQWFEDGTAPEGYEHLGGCVDPR